MAILLDERRLFDIKENVLRWKIAQYSMDGTRYWYLRIPLLDTPRLPALAEKISKAKNTEPKKWSFLDYQMFQNESF